MTAHAYPVSSAPNSRPRHDGISQRIAIRRLTLPIQHLKECCVDAWFEFQNGYPTVAGANSDEPVLVASLPCATQHPPADQSG